MIRTLNDLYSEFKIITVIGKGSYGCVYKARNTATGEIVALKKMFSSSTFESIVSEAEILHKINSPNIVSLLDVIKVGAVYYMVYSYSEFDLFGLVSTMPYSFFDVRRVSFYFRQFMSALSHIHNIHIIHADLKPDNIIVSAENVVQIADFGFSKQIFPNSSGDGKRTKMAALYYRPLELLLGYTHFGTEVDIWSAGCILFEIITKKPLFLANSEIDQIETIIEKCGEPDLSIFHEFKNMKKILSSNGNNRSNSNYILKSKWKNIDEFLRSNVPPEFVENGATDLMAKMLCYDPVKRITAEAALSHHFLNIEVGKFPIINVPEIHQIGPKRSRPRLNIDRLANNANSKHLDIHDLRPKRILVPMIPVE